MDEFEDKVQEEEEAFIPQEEYCREQFEDEDEDKKTMGRVDEEREEADAAKAGLAASLDAAIAAREKKKDQAKATKTSTPPSITVTDTDAPNATSKPAKSKGPGMITNGMSVCKCGGVVFDCASTNPSSTDTYVPIKPVIGTHTLSLVTDNFSNVFDYAFPNYPNLSKLLDLSDPRAKFIADIYFTVRSTISLHTILDVTSMYSEYADYDDVNAHPMTGFALHGCALANLVDVTTRKDICMDHTTDSCVCSMCHSKKVTPSNPLQICSVCCFTIHLECNSHTPPLLCDGLCIKCSKEEESKTSELKGKGKRGGRRGRSRGSPALRGHSSGVTNTRALPVVNDAVPIARQHLAMYRCDNFDIDCKLAQYVCPWYGHSPFSWSQLTKKYIANRDHPLFSIYKSMLTRVWKDPTYRKNGIMVALMWSGTYGCTPTYRSIDKYAWFSYAYCSSRFIGVRPMYGMPSSSCFSIDRINVWGHYELGNIRWLDESGQNSNQQKDYSMHARHTKTKQPPHTPVRVSIVIPSRAPYGAVSEMVRAAVIANGINVPPDMHIITRDSSLSKKDRSALSRTCSK